MGRRVAAEPANPKRGRRRRKNVNPAGQSAAFGRGADAIVVDLDDLLLARAGRGDQDSFSTLYDRLMPAMFGVARRVVRNPAQAEEVAQDAMVELWRTATRFDASRGSARTYALTITHRRAVDRVRSEEASRRRDTADARRTSDRGRQDPDEMVIDLLDRQRIDQALDALTPLQVEAVKLAYYEGRTQTEMAALLDVPLGTVKTRVRDGLIRLRDTMGVTS